MRMENSGFGRGVSVKENQGRPWMFMEKGAGFIESSHPYCSISLSCVCDGLIDPTASELCNRACSVARGRQSFFFSCTPNEDA
jgi:hypothetical protein